MIRQAFAHLFAALCLAIYAWMLYHLACMVDLRNPRAGDVYEITNPTTQQATTGTVLRLTDGEAIFQVNNQTMLLKVDHMRLPEWRRIDRTGP